MPETEILKARYRRYLITSVILILLALLLTHIGINGRSIWLLIIAFAILFAGFGLLFTGLTLRAERKVIDELRKSSNLHYND